MDVKREPLPNIGTTWKASEDRIVSGYVVGIQDDIFTLRGSYNLTNNYY